MTTPSAANTALAGELLPCTRMPLCESLLYEGHARADCPAAYRPAVALALQSKDDSAALESIAPLLVRTKALWQSKFPAASLRDHILKLTGEIRELTEQPSDPAEWADVLLCYLMAASAAGYSARDLIMFASLKMSICERQEFVPVGDGTYRRVKTSDSDALLNLADAMGDDIMLMADEEILAEDGKQP